MTIAAIALAGLLMQAADPAKVAPTPPPPIVDPLKDLRTAIAISQRDYMMQKANFDQAERSMNDLYSQARKLCTADSGKEFKPLPIICEGQPLAPPKDPDKPPSTK